LGSFGSLGRDSGSGIGTAPNDMQNLTFISFKASVDALAIADIAAGYFHACALFSTGSLVCWGNNDQGQLGSEVTGVGPRIGDASGEMALLNPIAFKTSLATSRLTQVAAGNDFTCGKEICKFYIYSFYIIFYYLYSQNKKTY
jgi:alpha-tubulin suppressor-like RCC1 family protein